jgi:hypothetical protein
MPILVGYIPYTHALAHFTKSRKLWHKIVLYLM